MADTMYKWDSLLRFGIRYNYGTAVRSASHKLTVFARARKRLMALSGAGDTHCRSLDSGSLGCMVLATAQNWGWPGSLLTMGVFVFLP